MNALHSQGAQDAQVTQPALLPQAGLPAPRTAAQGRTRLRRRIGLLILAAIALFALLGPALIGTDPARQVLNDSLQPPGARYWLGADVLGRDLLARLAARRNCRWAWRCWRR